MRDVINIHCVCFNIHSIVWYILYLCLHISYISNHIKKPKSCILLPNCFKTPQELDNTREMWKMLACIFKFFLHYQVLVLFYDGIINGLDFCIY